MKLMESVKNKLKDILVIGLLYLIIVGGINLMTTRTEKINEIYAQKMTDKLPKISHQ